MRAVATLPWLLAVVLACAGCMAREAVEDAASTLPQRPRPLQQGSAFAPQALQWARLAHDDRHAG